MEVLALYQARKDFFVKLLFEHMQISFMAVLIAACLGLILGILVSGRRIEAFVLGLVNVCYTVPSISLLGFLIPFTGIGNKTAVIALSVYGLMPMLRNTVAGLAAVDPAVIEAAKGMGSTSLQIMLKIRLPLALPVIMTGFRSMVVMVIALSGVSSFIGAGGLGVAIYRGITTNNAAMTLAGSLLIAGMALGLDLLLGFVFKRICRKWRLEG